MRNQSEECLLSPTGISIDVSGNEATAFNNGENELVWVNKNMKNIIDLVDYAYAESDKPILLFDRENICIGFIAPLSDKAQVKLTKQLKDMIS